MMRSMFSGVSGLKTHQTKMDVIGNNIANVNTVGFKSGRVTFQEIFSQTLKGAGAPDVNAGRSGSNPMQIGLGVGVSAIDTNMTRGSSQRTDSPFDLAIEGDGFFMVKSSNADTYKFTRAGNFNVDARGFLNMNGNSVCGWDFDKDPTDSTKLTLNTINQPTPLNIYRTINNASKLEMDPQETKAATLSGNLDSRILVPTGAPIKLTSDNSVNIPMTVYDNLGNEVKINITMYKLSDGAGTSTWQMKAADSAGNAIVLKNSDDGKVLITGSKIDATTLANYTKILQIPAGSAGGSSKAFEVTVNLAGLTMFANDSTAKPAGIDGNPAGGLVNFNIGPDGVVTGVYSNGKQQSIGCVAITTFANPGGLLKVGENMFIPSPNSGPYAKGYQPGTGGSGSLNPGTLEMSNVDLSKEFTDMIVTQRGFQANSRIITASDEMLQELVSMKR